MVYRINATRLEGARWPSERWPVRIKLIRSLSSLPSTVVDNGARMGDTCHRWVRGQTSIFTVSRVAHNAHWFSDDRRGPLCLCPPPVATCGHWYRSRCVSHTAPAHKIGALSAEATPVVCNFVAYKMGEEGSLGRHLPMAYISLSAVSHLKEPTEPDPDCGCPAPPDTAGKHDLCEHIIKAREEALKKLEGPGKVCPFCLCLAADLTVVQCR